MTEQLILQGEPIMKLRLVGRAVLIALACLFGIGAVHYAVSIDPDTNVDATRAIAYAIMALTCVTGIRYFED
jgi:hypothetical protein